MASSRVVYPVFIFISIVLSYFLLSTAKGHTQRERDQEKAALAALMGGDTSGGESNSDSSYGRNQAPGSGSLFETDFWQEGVPKNATSESLESVDEGEPEILEPASADNPVNPQTGQPFSDATMAQFDTLRKKFPGNSIIPKRMSDSDRTAEQEKRQQYSALQSRIIQGQASSSEVNEFYDYQSKSIVDRLQLLEYVLKEQGDEMSPEIKTQFTKIVEMNQRQKASYDEARKRALAANNR